ncbi:MAG: hypothetical protein K2L42_06450 [Clostridia bacterium]|nr:hypothetical protein [Clostridia bacterium]
MSEIPFNTLVIFVWGSYLAVFAAALIATVFSARARRASKRPFMCLTNAYTAVTLALFLTVKDLSQSVMTAALFWAAGYLLYGLMCLCSVRKPAVKQTAEQVVMTSTAPMQPTVRAAREPAAPAPAAKNNVRLEHAVAVTDKLLTKNLSKTDRQDLEKLKNTLAVLQIKGTLTPTEAEILNENFNALLKLMAKYNV